MFPPLIQPDGVLLARDDLKERLSSFHGLRFEPCDYRRLVSTVGRPTDASLERLGWLRKGMLAFAFAQPDLSDARASAPRMWEIVMLNATCLPAPAHAVAVSVPNWESIIPGEHAKVHLWPELVEEYPLSWSQGGFCARDDLWEVIRPFIDNDFWRHIAIDVRWRGRAAPGSPRTVPRIDSPPSEWEPTAPALPCPGSGPARPRGEEIVIETPRFLRGLFRRLVEIRLGWHELAALHELVEVLAGDDRFLVPDPRALFGWRINTGIAPRSVALAMKAMDETIQGYGWLADLVDHLGVPHLLDPAGTRWMAQRIRARLNEGAPVVDGGWTFDPQACLALADRLENAPRVDADEPARVRVPLRWEEVALMALVGDEVEERAGQPMQKDFLPDGSVIDNPFWPPGAVSICSEVGSMIYECDWVDQIDTSRMLRITLPARPVRWYADRLESLDAIDASNLPGQRDAPLDRAALVGRLRTALR